MKKLFKKLTAGFAAVVMSVSVFAASASAATYENYSYDRWGDAIPSQAGYVATKSVLGTDIGAGKFSSPSDLFIDAKNQLYIVDKDNHRIVVTDLDFNLIRIIDSFNLDGETTKLSQPQGIYVDDTTGHMYIADTGNSRIIKADMEGNVDLLFTKPDSPLFGAELLFNPTKVVVDPSGNVYAVTASINRGAVMFDEFGVFISFYGANTVEATAEIIANAFWNLISTEAQKLRQAKNAPTGFSNFDIDGQFIYTVTESTESTADQVKKVNPRGDNVLDAIEMQGENFGDIEPAYYNAAVVDSAMTDIDIGANGEMTLLDRVHGRVHQFDKDGWRLFIMGGIGWMQGQFQAPTAVETRDDKIFVADQRKNNITVFTRTVFGELVTNASQYFNRAEYAESKSLWEEVLTYDGNYRRAYTGIGLAYLFDEDYTAAMENFKIAMNRYYFDRSFEGYRNEILRQNFGLIVGLIVAVIALNYVYKYYKKKHKKNTWGGR